MKRDSNCSKPNHYMKNLLFCSLMLVGFTSIAQKKVIDSTFSIKDLIGVWQVNSPVISSAYQATFQFYANGKFVYNVSGYADLNPLSNVSGSYRLTDSAVSLKIEEYSILSGFKIQ